MKEIKPNTFIFEFENAVSRHDCKTIIDLFEKNKDEHYQGKIGQNLEEDLNIKKSTDLFISGKEGWKEVDKLFFTVLAKSLATLKKEIDFSKAHLKTWVTQFRELNLDSFTIGISMAEVMNLATGS